MNFDNLRSFLAVVECKSFSKAAKTLHITQPTLSNRIAVLEKELNAALFIRSWHGVELTAQGKIFLPQIIQILSEVDKLFDLANNLSNEEIKKQKKE